MPKKILLVDDQPNIVRVLEINLQRAGYDVISASDGREALVKVEQEKPDLVVLDVVMPHVDGFEVLRNLKANPDTRGILVIMLTVRAQGADIVYGHQTGADIYLTKPVNPMELLSIVHRLFAGPPVPPP